METLLIVITILILLGLTYHYIYKPNKADKLKSSERQESTEVSIITDFETDDKKVEETEQPINQ